MKVAILDDYQNVALKLADWSGVERPQPLDHCRGIGNVVIGDLGAARDGGKGLGPAARNRRGQAPTAKNCRLLLGRSNSEVGHQRRFRARAKACRRITPRPRSGFGSLLSEATPTRNTLSVLMYYNGRGVPRDYTESVKWFRLAESR